MLFAAATVATASEDHMQFHDETGSRVRQELAGIVEEYADAPLGDVTMNELFDIAGRLSVREQEGRYIERQQRKSFMLQRKKVAV